MCGRFEQGRQHQEQERAGTQPADDAAQREEANAERVRGHAQYIAEHGNTFLGYQWLLSGLSRQPVGGTSGGIQAKVITRVSGPEILL
jgi:hypothetical protein